jgi:hypothetical protein
MTDLYASINKYAEEDQSFAREVDPDGTLLPGPQDWNWRQLCEDCLRTFDLDDPCAQIAALNAILEAAAAFDAHVLY